MTNSKDKGTAAETLVVRHLRSTYWPHAERRALSGKQDKGDITGTPGLAWEVKAAKTLAIPRWLRETQEERLNAQADYATLVLKRPGMGKMRAGFFWALMDRQLFHQLDRQAFPDGSPVHGFVTTVRQTNPASAMLTLSLDSAPFAVAYYPSFTLTHLNTMSDILLLAGYGTKQ